MIDESQVVPAVAMFLSAVSLIFAALNHKKIVSKCCGKTYSASIDVMSSSPVGAGAGAEAEIIKVITVDDKNTKHSPPDS